MAALVVEGALPHIDSVDNHRHGDNLGLPRTWQHLTVTLVCPSQHDCTYHPTKMNWYKIKCVLHTFSNAHTHIWTNVHICMLCMHIRTHIYNYELSNMHVYIHRHTFTYICTHLRIHIHTYN